jgi:ferredoxin
MKAIVDHDICIGCAMCPQVCPEIFKMDGDMAVSCLDPVPGAAEATCRFAADQCPVKAIRIE